MDHIYASFSDSISGIGPPIEKHHALTWIKLGNCSLGKQEKRKFVSWKWEDGDWERAHFLLGFRDDGYYRDLPAEFSNLSVDEACDYLTHEILRIQSLVVIHHKSVWFQQSCCAWMNENILRLFQQ